MRNRQMTSVASALRREKCPPTSTVGRGRTVVRRSTPDANHWCDGLTTVCFGDSLEHYSQWDSPNCIVSDGAYGVLGFEGDTCDHIGMPEWYEPHVKAWSLRATAQTVLWFWNSEIGWASVHPVIEKHGWRYVNANIWDKGLGHIAGNVNTQKIRRFPVVSEICVQYVFEPRIEGKLLKRWLLDEWNRTGLPVREANQACGVADAAVRKYLDQGHVWYWMPPGKFQMLVDYANLHGQPDGRPYFSTDGVCSMTAEDWAKTRAPFICPHGVTNVWSRPPLRNGERIKVNGKHGKAVHLNQKPLDLMTTIIKATTLEDSVVWEPFGGLFSASVAARHLGRRSFGAEIDATYFNYGMNRIVEESKKYPLI